MFKVAPVLCNLSQRTAKGETQPRSLYEASTTTVLKSKINTDSSGGENHDHRPVSFMDMDTTSSARFYQTEFVIFHHEMHQISKNQPSTLTNQRRKIVG